MKNTILKTLLASIALLLLASLFVTCGSRDDRDRVRADFGEPDDIITQGQDPFWRETWLYNSRGVAFEFRRTSGCGTVREVYLYQQYAFTPVPDDSLSAKMLPLPQTSSNPLTP